MTSWFFRNYLHNRSIFILYIFSFWIFSLLYIFILFAFKDVELSYRYASINCYHSNCFSSVDHQQSPDCSRSDDNNCCFHSLSWDSKGIRNLMIKPKLPFLSNFPSFPFLILLSFHSTFSELQFYISYNYFSVFVDTVSPISVLHFSHFFSLFTLIKSSIVCYFIHFQSIIDICNTCK